MSFYKRNSRRTFLRESEEELEQYEIIELDSVGYDDSWAVNDRFKTGQFIYLTPNPSEDEIRIELRKAGYDLKPSDEIEDAFDIGYYIYDEDGRYLIELEATGL